MKRYFVMTGAALLLCGAMSGVVQAEPVRQQALVIDGVYARATVPGQTVGAAYLIIENNGDASDRLVSASSSVAHRVVLHSSQMEQGMAHMQHVTSLEIPAHGRIVLKPGGLHLMLEDLKKPLQEGQTLSMKLKFERSGEVEVALPVQPVMADEPMGNAMHHDMMH